MRARIFFRLSETFDRVEIESLAKDQRSRGSKPHMIVFKSDPIEKSPTNPFLTRYLCKSSPKALPK